MDPNKYTAGDDVGDFAPIVGNKDAWGAANSYVRYAAEVPSQDRLGNCLSCHDFGSAHVGGWNATMGDGSVRTLSYAMRLTIHQALASIQGDEVLTEVDN